MDKKGIFKIVVNAHIFVLTLVGSYFFISTLTSCSSSHNVEVSGVTRIHVTDTTYVKHNGFVRSKNYLPYE